MKSIYVCSIVLIMIVFSLNIGYYFGIHKGIKIADEVRNHIIQESLIGKYSEVK